MICVRSSALTAALEPWTSSGTERVGQRETARFACSGVVESGLPSSRRSRVVNVRWLDEALVDVVRHLSAHQSNAKSHTVAISS
jgi:hypothetical protein